MNNNPMRPQMNLIPVQLNRTTRNRILYVLVLAAVVAVVAGVGLLIVQRFPQSQIYVIVTAFILLLIPGRMQQFYWKDYFAGQKLQLKGQHGEALARFERFLAALHERPALRHLIWFSQWFYSRNVEVLALNNMSVSAMWLQQADKAETWLNSAVKLDPESPLPYFNLAVLHYAGGDDAQGAKNLTKAETLGYKRASIRGLAALARDTSKLATRREGKAAKRELSQSS